MLLNCDIRADGYESKLLEESLVSILDANILLSMATISESSPYINTAYYAYTQDLKLYFLSQPARKHSVNLESNPNISLTIFDSHQPWGNHLQGLQIFGQCVIAQEQSVCLAFDVYTKRFAKLSDTVLSFADYERGIIKSRFYEITITSVKIFDEPRFGKDVWINAQTINKERILGGA